MRREPSRLEDRTFDLLVVGGGVLGASIARDGVQRGLSTALVELDDFGAGASGNSLKIVHGGFRYLRTLSLARARRSFRERSAWLRIAPHLIDPLPILIPTYARGTDRRSLLRLAERMSGWLQLSNREEGGLLPVRLPRGYALDRAEVARRAPLLAEREGLTGGVVFHDGLMYSPERLVLETVLDAYAAGAVVTNHARVEGPLRVRGRSVRVTVRDMLSEQTWEAEARHVVNAAGGRAEYVARSLTGGRQNKPAATAMALNVMVSGIGVDLGLAVRSRGSVHDGRRGGRRLFVIPWRGETLIGTAYYRAPAAVALDHGLRSGIESFLSEVDEAAPELAIRSRAVRVVPHGCLPLKVRRAGPELVPLDKGRIVDHGREGHPELITAWTDKFTTARHVAERVIDLVFRKRAQSPPPCRTAIVPLPGAPRESLSDLAARTNRSICESIPVDVVDHLIRTYGRRVTSVLQASSARSGVVKRLHPGAPVTERQIRFGIENEMALTAEDLLLRRTELGARALATEEVRARVSRLLQASREARWPERPGRSRSVQAPGQATTSRRERLS